MCCKLVDGVCNLWSASCKEPLGTTTPPFHSPTLPHHSKLNPIQNIVDTKSAVLRNVTGEHSTSATALRQLLCTDREVGLRDVAYFNMLKANILKSRWNRRLWRWWSWGIVRNSRTVGLQWRCGAITQFPPAGVMYCHLTATVWRRAANELPQQFCNVSCSCVLTVWSVLQSVHSSKVMPAAEQKVTCKVHWQLWARLWHRGDQMHLKCL
jgi:hypothetical protein